MFETIKKAPVQDDQESIPFFSIGASEDNYDDVIKSEIPILALRNTVLFPGVVIPITVGRDKSIAAVNEAFDNDKFIGVVSQKELQVEKPDAEDLYEVGTVAKIIKKIKMPDGSTTAILQGRKKFVLEELMFEEPFFNGRISQITMDPVDNKLEYEAIISSIRDMAKKIIELSPQIPSEAVMMLNNIESHSFLQNFIASNLNVSVAKKQKVLELKDPLKSAETILKHMSSELNMLEIKNQIDSKVKGDIEEQQRNFYLNQQLKTIQEELGQNPQQEELEVLAAKAKKKKWPEEAAKAFSKTLDKVKRMNPQVAEYSIQMNYLELMLELPWNEYTKDNFNLKKVKTVLDKDHYGLEDVKQRILEHLAVLKLKGDMKAPILCLVGPPGVGKTSLGKSIANAIQRKFIRMSLGGLHDESEIRGHRKTYIGAMPGRIIQSVKKAGSGNPLFILDEIDKIGSDHRGDPSSALLEVLDPEQNETFYDNYLEMEYDLSKVLFIATANSLNSIQPALLDRMEIIEIGGYSTEEKVEIAKKHLIPEQKAEHGLKSGDVKLKDEVIDYIIRKYTRESGVRSLNRNIAGVMRGVAKSIAMDEKYNKNVKISDLKGMLGVEKFPKERIAEDMVPGLAIGLAWTRVGGDILYIESSLSEGKGKLILTGNLGDVMKESATTALSYIKANADKLNISKENLEKFDVHIHVPEGAIPKDGPSAGITMLTALVSAFKGKAMKKNLAMTGEITLRGKVLPVGGIKEKVLAAKRSGVDTIILCADNRRHVEEIDPRYIGGVEFIYVERMHEVLHYALGIETF
ncbi:endopeptidase La [Portibacter lacus]|uniref:Lon protease n=1 Tax=Portibacter lacus TaxID=1099794 RepID=A0AA37WHA9_9BACT|nr:endopeptidase La [Portibacter lacus]GLR19199.1 Lon protease [Portibacter lacus]